MLDYARRPIQVLPSQLALYDIVIEASVLLFMAFAKSNRRNNSMEKKKKIPFNKNNNTNLSGFFFFFPQHCPRVALFGASMKIDMTLINQAPSRYESQEKNTPQGENNNISQLNVFDFLNL